jgi:hypothetical protein
MSLAAMAIAKACEMTNWRPIGVGHASHNEGKRISRSEMSTLGEFLQKIG